MLHNTCDKWLGKLGSSNVLQSLSQAVSKTVLIIYQHQQHCIKDFIKNSSNIKVLFHSFIGTLMIHSLVSKKYKISFLYIVSWLPNSNLKYNKVRMKSNGGLERKAWSCKNLHDKCRAERHTLYTLHINAISLLLLDVTKWQVFMSSFSFIHIWGHMQGRGT